MFDYLQKFNNLPQNLRDSVSSEAAMTVISDLEKEYKIDLASTVMKVMAKIIPLADLTSYFISDFSLSTELAKKLTADLKERLFFQVANYLGYNPSYSSVIPKTSLLSNVATGSRPENAYFAEVEKIIKNSGITFAGTELGSRFKNILLTHLKGIRSRVDVRLTLNKDIISGGLGLDHQVIDKIFKLADEFLAQKNVSELKKEVSAPESKKEVSQEALNKLRQSYEGATARDIPYNLQEAIKNKQLSKPSVPLNLPLEDEKSLNLPKPEEADKKLIEAPDKQDLIEAAPKKEEEKEEESIVLPVIVPQNNQLIKTSKSEDQKIIKKPEVVSQDKTVASVKVIIPPVAVATPPLVLPNLVPKINRPPERKPGLMANILKPKEQPKKEESVITKIAVETPLKPQSIIAKRSEAVTAAPAAKVTPVVNSAPPTPKAKQIVSDISAPKVMGPLEELSYLDIVNFRRLGASPLEATAKVEAKIKLMEKDGYDQMIAGVLAWRKSLINSLYLKMGQEALAKEITFKQCADSYQKAKAHDFLFWEEIEAIIALNSRLMF